MDVAVLHKCLDTGRPPRDVASDVAARAEAAEGLYIDVSQSHSRRPWSHSRAGTRTTATRMYSCSEDRVMLEEEMLGALGRHIDARGVVSGLDPVPFARRTSLCSTSSARNQSD